MTQPRKEQINILRSYWSVFVYTAISGTTSATISAASLHASSVTQTSGGNPATNPPTRGIVSTSSGGFVRLRNVNTGLTLDDTGSQIFGRLTFSGGNYTINYKKLSSGSEVSATLPGTGSYSVQVLFSEVMNFGEVPAAAEVTYGISQELLSATSTNGTISGDLIVGGNSTLGDSISDTITLFARFISDLIPSPDNTISLGSSSLRYANGNFTQYTARADITNSVKSVFNSSGITITGTSFAIDGNNSINLGNTNTTGITIGRTCITTSINGTLNTGGGLFLTTAIKTSIYSASLGDLVRCDPSGAGFTINLPTAIGNINKSIIIKNITSSINTITIDAFGSETIDGSLTQLITIGFQSITLISDNSNWIIV